MTRDAELQNLAANAASGDLDAFEALLRNIHGDLISYLYLSSVAASEIDDIAQNVAIRMHASLSAYKSNQPFLPWLRGIAKHVMLNHQRTQTRESKRIS